MERRKECPNKLLVILMLVCVLLSIIILGIMSYDKFLKKEEKPTNTVVIPTTPVTNGNCTNDFDYVKIFEGMKDYDGSYSTYKMETMSMNDKHVYAYITIDGKVKYKVDNSEKNHGIYILKNIDNAKDIVFFESDGYGILYILTKSGDVYEYNIEDYENKIDTAKKKEDLKNIVEFAQIMSCPTANAGCDFVIVAIDKNNSYHHIIG